MQSVLYANISESDLIQLFGINSAILEHWQNLGCVSSSDGCYSLPKVIRWLKSYHQVELNRKRISALFTQKELSQLFGISRQTVTKWFRSGLPRRKDKRYNLQQVCQWLQCYYQVAAKREYERSLQAMRKKVSRNAAQLHRFLAGGEAG